MSKVIRLLPGFIIVSHNFKHIIYENDTALIPGTGRNSTRSSRGVTECEG